MRQRVLALVIALNLAFLDQVVKQWVFVKKPFMMVNDFFNLAYVENRGCAWGMLQGQVWPLAIFAIIVFAFLIWKQDKIAKVPTMALLYAGIGGNLIDRIGRGFVVDMLDFHWGTAHFPCFNFADTFICVAVALLILDEALGIFARRTHRER